MIKLFLSIILSVLFVSCANQKIEFEHKFDKEHWIAFNKVEFDFNNADVNTEFEIVMEIQLTEDFNSNDFAILMTQRNDEGESRYSSYSLDIKNKDGHFINSESKSNYHEYTLILNPRTKFNSNSMYHFIFEHRLTVVNMKGIASLCLKLNQL
ncbi:MAG: hypothetical protein KAG84_02740 [Bacteroidales bacterium]|nr:hypothetical protein [Bacteroidales bacterium]